MFEYVIAGAIGFAIAYMIFRLRSPPSSAVVRELVQGDAVGLFRDVASNEVRFVPLHRVTDYLYVGRIQRGVPFLGRSYVSLYCAVDPSDNLGTYSGKPFFYLSGIVMGPDMALGTSLHLGPESFIMKNLKLKVRGAESITNIADVTRMLMVELAKNVAIRESEVTLTPNIAIAVSIPPKEIVEKVVISEIINKYSLIVNTMHVTEAYASIFDKIRQLLAMKISAVPGWMRALIWIIIAVAVAVVIIHAVGIV